MQNFFWQVKVSSLSLSLYGQAIILIYDFHIYLLYQLRRDTQQTCQEFSRAQQTVSNLSHFKLKREHCLYCPQGKLAYFLDFSSYFVLNREQLIHNCIYFYFALSSIRENTSYPQASKIKTFIFYYGKIKKIHLIRNHKAGKVFERTSPRARIEYSRSCQKLQYGSEPPCQN